MLSVAYQLGFGASLALAIFLAVQKDQVMSGALGAPLQQIAIYTVDEVREMMEPK